MNLYREWQRCRVRQISAEPQHKGLVCVRHIFDSLFVCNTVGRFNVFFFSVTLKNVFFFSLPDCRSHNKEIIKKTVKRTRNKLIDFERDKQMPEIPNDSDYMIGLLMSL